MENSKKMKVIALVISVVVLVVIGVFVLCISSKEKPSKVNQEQTQINNQVEEEVWERRALHEISGDYTLEEAEKDKAFIVKNDNLPQNIAAINDFSEDLSSNKNATLRVVMETADSLLYIVDIEVSGDNFVVTQKDTQLSGDVIENIYSREKYSFNDGLKTLEDGTLLQVYSLTTENLDNTVDLFAYIVEENNVEDAEISESGEEEKIIEILE